MIKLIKTLALRFKEPSSWAGLAGVAALIGLNLDPGVANGIALAGAGVASIVAILLPE